MNKYMSIVRCEQCREYEIKCESDNGGRIVFIGEYQHVVGTTIEDCAIRNEGTITTSRQAAKIYEDFHHPDLVDTVVYGIRTIVI